MIAIILFCLLHTAHADDDSADLNDRLYAIEQQGLWNEMLINTSYAHALRKVDEPCEPHWIEVTDGGRIKRHCGIEHNKRK